MFRLHQFLLHFCCRYIGWLLIFQGGAKYDSCPRAPKHTSYASGLWTIIIIIIIIRIHGLKARSSVAESLKNLSNNDTSMKFGGFKGQMMLYPKKHLDIKKNQYGGYNPRWQLKKIEMLYNSL